MTVEPGSATSTARGEGVGRGRLARLLAVAILLVLVGYLVGSHRSQTREVTGPAIVGDHVVTMKVDDTYVGFSDSMWWIDANNAARERGWPDCLGRNRTVPSVTFGIVHVDYPNGSSAEQVVYVVCRT